VFFDDIIDEGVLPYLSLAVDGLTDSVDTANGNLELRPQDSANDDQRPDTEMPLAPFDPDQLDVYGWESNWWKKIKSYIGF
jgi:hypothetical protein